jgi:hypothetical protein
MSKSGFLGLILLMVPAGAMAAEPVAERFYAHLDVVMTGPQSVRAGEDVRVNVALANATAAPIRIATEPGLALTDNEFRVEGPRGLARLLPLGLALKHQSDEAASRAAWHLTQLQQVISPGGRYEETSAISRIYDMSAPGRYRITVRRRLPDRSIVTSNAITLTVAK